MNRLAIVTTHPIQYNAPLFKLLAAQPGLDVKVFYTLGEAYAGVKDKGFGKTIVWDVPLLEGYAYEFLENAATEPGTSHFKGVVNPGITASIEAFQPTAILVFGWSFSGHLKALKYFKHKIPVYFRGDSTLLDEQKSFNVILRRLALMYIYKHIDKAFYVATNNRQYFLKHGIKEQNLVFAPHAIDNARFAEDARYVKESKSIRAGLGIPEQDLVFLFAGKFENKKSPLLLIRAFKRLTKENTHLIFVGNGVLENKLNAEAEGYANIHFLPFQNQASMPAVYRAGDVLVLPSGGPGETWGLCVNEAMACGLPVIVSDKVGCAVDLVQVGANGYIFEAGNAESLLEKLSLCAAKPKEELQRMGSSSRDIIQDWSYEKVCEAVVEELENLGSKSLGGKSYTHKVI